ncbi:MAG: glycosyltransferase [Dolichospermum sp. DET50]|jgi:cellulose synthase/poly-beta-1,6-N-acetylglucosamine synthase-like glycosyltransferase|uniref:glycosyltransferase n=1 Tax=Dolichospermum sp. UHCC 0259 TaxID=2590010 RepID=UPI001447E3FE|nr:glycosyltransferase [Dolichospermum sp. UHCC 0259]MBO1052843.1 glycosyltransferase [Dolichospermum sp. DET73]MBS3029170.1 glycosyltransferase [Dolichospermum sp. DET66]MBS3034371.1 glycosyltransferase [Dolichospermum sp. DET67]MBS3039574.1 glycosyltransferase [Dolichospermum sp. DET50]QSX66787.1 MAG: glycosyltransferase [Dolichospermum sp. DET69]
MQQIAYNVLLKITGIVAIASIFTATLSLLSHLNLDYFVLAYLCGLGVVMSAVFFIYFIIVNIHTVSPVKVEQLSSETPEVAVIVPIYNEDIHFLKATVDSIVKQDYPIDKIKLFIANDARRDEIATFTTILQSAYPKLSCYHVLPPSKDSSDREGEAKAGALNAAWKELRNLFPGINYIETRDCDDCVGDPQFLRKCTTYLINHPTVGLVQTYKETQLLDESDPFDTREVFLQSYVLPGKIWLGGVFSLGSGTVYRQQALVDVGGFDAWNMVEDVTTTVRILQKGWASQALDVVGVSTQAPVTDLENFLKQRSVWSLDAFRLVFFVDLSGLSLKQRLAFCTKAISELLYPTSVFLSNVTIAISLIIGNPMFLSVPPIVFVAIAFMTLFELLVFKGNILFGWKHKTLELALLFANLKMVWVAIVNGRNKKPKYVVTRKTAKHQSYLHYCRLHIALLILLIMGIVRVVSTGIALEHSIFLVAAIYWSIRLVDVMRLALYQPQTN